MEWQALLIDGYGRVLASLEKTLDGLPPGDLNQSPHPDCNSPGWITWHLTRVQDSHVADLMGEAQLWLSGGWHARFNRPADPDDTGFGHSSKDVAAFRAPDAATLLAYHRAVLERTQGYLAIRSPADLDRG